MAWIYLPISAYSPEPAASILEQGLSEASAQSPIASSTPTPKESSCQESGTGGLTTRQFGTMYPHSMESRGEEGLMSFLAGFPVRTYQSLEKKKELRKEKKAASGESMPASWVKYDRASSSWKMFQGSLWGGLEEFSGTWPSSGLMQDGECMELVQWVPHIHGIGCFLWPTPSATNEFGIAWDTAKRLLMGIKTRKSGAKIGTDLKWIPYLRWLQNGGQPFKGVLNYRFSEWLMGWPRDWTVYDSQATEWYRGKAFRRGKK